MTVFSRGVTTGALAAFAMGNPILGGLLTQAGSIIDGVDGDLARFADRIGALTGRGLATLTVLAALTNAVVLLRVVRARRVL